MPMPLGEPTLPLDRFAAVTALIDAGRPRDDVLDAASMTREQWTEAQAGWLFKMAQQVRLKRFELQNRFNDMLLGNLQALGRGEAVEVGDGCRLDAPPTPSSAPDAPSQSGAAPAAVASSGRSSDAQAPGVVSPGAVPPVGVPPVGVPPVAAPPVGVPSVAAPPEQGVGVAAPPPAPPSGSEAVPSHSKGARRRPAMSTAAMPMMAPAGAKAIPFAGAGPPARPAPSDGATPFAPPADQATQPPGAGAVAGSGANAPATPFAAPAGSGPSAARGPDMPAQLTATAQGDRPAGRALPFGPARGTGGEAASARARPSAPGAPDPALPFGRGAAANGPAAAGPGAPLTATVTAGAEEIGRAMADLPFSGRKAAPPAASGALEPSASLGQTVTADAAGSAGLPFDGTGEPILTLEQFASLEAEMSVTPDRLDEVLHRYGLDASSLKTERTIWAKRLIGDADGRARFQQVKRDYKAWLSRQG